MSKLSTDATYGISRVDDPAHRSHLWRVSLRRRGEHFVKNFTDKKWGGKRAALRAASAYRDQLLIEQPPLSRKEFCNTKRNHNRTGLTGVYTYSKSWTLKDGTKNETWYWEAHWPTKPGEYAHKSFSVKRYGEDVARQLAIRARAEGLQAVDGVYWASERGDVKKPPNSKSEHTRDSSSQAA